MRHALIALGLMAAGPAVAADAPPPPTPPPMALVLEVNATLEPVMLGQTPLGPRRVIRITGGTFSGPGIHGRILPGGTDYQALRPDGDATIDTEYYFETDDGVLIRGRDLGVNRAPDVAGQPRYLYVSSRFEAPIGKYGWLNDSVFVGHISPAGDGDHPAVRITVWKVG